MREKSFIRSLAVCFAVAIPLTAIAEDAVTVLWRGSTDYGSCSRVRPYASQFGIKWPTNESVSQKLIGELYLARAVDEAARDRVLSCAENGASEAGATALLTTGLSAAPSLKFKASFDACLKGQGLGEFTKQAVAMRYQTSCDWQTNREELAGR